VDLFHHNLLIATIEPVLWARFPTAQASAVSRRSTARCSGERIERSAAVRYGVKNAGRWCPWKRAIQEHRCVAVS
jgi:hypothetical protein